MKYLTILTGLVIATGSLWAKTDLVSVPNRDKVQITIYNSADLTLVRETRALTLRKGVNKLQFSWANTLIDPTSLNMKPLKNGDKIDVDSLIFPPRVKDLGLWKVHSEIAGDVPFEITYFTSGINWRANYIGTLSKDETTMRLQGYVRVGNRSGEDYANAQTRLIVGKVNLLERIAALARRRQAYGSPYDRYPVIDGKHEELKERIEEVWEKRSRESKSKQIKKEGLSEYFLYTIEGTETIKNQWTKRLPSFEAKEIPVVNLYKYEEDRYGRQCVRFLSFKNDKVHKLGDTPIPGGAIKVFRTTDEKEHLGYTGQSSFKYIPVDEDVELDLGAVRDVIVEPKLMKLAKDKHTFNQNGNVDGWDELRQFQVTVKNTKALPVKIEITRNFQDKYWDMTREKEVGEYKKIDVDTARFTIELKPRSQQQFTYTLRTYHGKRREVKER